jgi:hypothetical protein
MDIDYNSDSAACDGMQESFSALSLDLNQPNMPEISQAILLLKSNLYENELQGIKIIRSLLAIPKNPPIKEVLQSKIVPSIIEMVYSRSIDFALEVVWILCNIASGNSESVKYLIEIEVLDFFNKVFDIDNNSFSLRDTITWAVGNIAGDSIYYRDLVLKSYIYVKIIAYSSILPIQKENEYRNLVWSLGNLARGKPRPSNEILITLFPIFQRAILQSTDNFILIDALLGFCYISEKINGPIFYSEYILKKIIIILNSNTFACAVQVLKLLGNYISCTEDTYTIFKRSGILNDLICSLSRFLQNPNKPIKKKVFFILSNLCGENNEIVSIMINLGIYEILYNMIGTVDKDISDEIIWVIGKTAFICSIENATILLERKWAPKLLEYFYITEKDEIKLVILEGLLKLYTLNSKFFTPEFQSELARMKNLRALQSTIDINLDNLSTLYN